VKKEADFLPVKKQFFTGKKTICISNPYSWIWIRVHHCFILSPGKMMFAVLQLWLSPFQCVLNQQLFWHLGYIKYKN